MGVPGYCGGEDRRREIEVLQCNATQAREDRTAQVDPLKIVIQEQLADHRKIHRNVQARPDEAHPRRVIDPKIAKKHVLPMLVGHLAGPRLADLKLHAFHNVHDV